MKEFKKNGPRKRFIMWLLALINENNLINQYKELITWLLTADAVNFQQVKNQLNGASSAINSYDPTMLNSLKEEINLELKGEGKRVYDTGVGICRLLLYTLPTNMGQIPSQVADIDMYLGKEASKLIKTEKNSLTLNEGLRILKTNFLKNNYLNACTTSFKILSSLKQNVTKFNKPAYYKELFTDTQIARIIFPGNGIDGISPEGQNFVYKAMNKNATGSYNADGWFSWIKRHMGYSYDQINVLKKRFENHFTKGSNTKTSGDTTSTGNTTSSGNTTSDTTNAANNQVGAIVTASSPAVKWIKGFQYMLNQAGILDDKGKPIVRDGILGPKTNAVLQQLGYSNIKEYAADVKSFQEQNSLSPDGIMGPLTYNKLKELGYKTIKDWKNAEQLKQKKAEDEKNKITDINQANNLQTKATTNTTATTSGLAGNNNTLSEMNKNFKNLLERMDKVQKNGSILIF